MSEMNAKCAHNLAACEGCPQLSFQVAYDLDCLWREVMKENANCECREPQHRERWLVALLVDSDRERK